MPKFRLRKDHHPVSLFQPEGGPDAFVVEPGSLIDAPGTLVTERPELVEPNPEDVKAVAEAARIAALAPLPDDAYIVERNGEEKAWPKATWELVGEKPPAKTADKPPVKEN